MQGSEARPLELRSISNQSHFARGPISNERGLKHTRTSGAAHSWEMRNFAILYFFRLPASGRRYSIRQLRSRMRVLSALILGHLSSMGRPYSCGVLLDLQPSGKPHSAVTQTSSTQDL